MEPRFEAVQSDTDSSFRCLSFSCESFAVDHAWHYHPEFELTWIAQSKGTRFVGDSIQRYAPGDLVLVGPNMPHCWHDDSAADATEQPKLVIVQFKPDCLGSDFFFTQEAANAAALLKKAALGVSFPLDTSARVGPLLRELSASSGLHRLARLLDVLEVLSQSPSTSLATQEFLFNNEVSAANRRRFAQVYRYIRENLAGDISQAEIAAKLSMSSPTFSRFFKVATGKTFVVFVNTLRIHEACRLLGSAQSSITDIAMACGFNNISNFNRQFLALKGMNPTEYCNKLRERRERAVLLTH